MNEYHVTDSSGKKKPLYFVMFTFVRRVVEAKAGLLYDCHRYTICSSDHFIVPGWVLP